MWQWGGIRVIAPLNDYDSEGCCYSVPITSVTEVQGGTRASARACSPLAGKKGRERDEEAHFFWAAFHSALSCSAAGRFSTNQLKPKKSNYKEKASGGGNGTQITSNPGISCFKEAEKFPAAQTNRSVCRLIFNESDL